jgi:hypothetical protein
MSFSIKPVFEYGSVFILRLAHGVVSLVSLAQIPARRRLLAPLLFSSCLRPCELPGYKIYPNFNESFVPTLDEMPLF